MKKPIQTKKERRLAQFFKALGNEWRLLIVELLVEEPRSVTELADSLDKSQNFISGHLKLLKLVGILKYESVGKFRKYSLNKDKIREILDAAHAEFFRLPPR